MKKTRRMISGGNVFVVNGDIFPDVDCAFHEGPKALATLAVALAEDPAGVNNRTRTGVHLMYKAPRRSALPSGFSGPAAVRREVRRDLPEPQMATGGISGKGRE